MRRCFLLPSFLFTLIALVAGCAHVPVAPATPVPAPPPVTPPATESVHPAPTGQSGLILVANVRGVVNQILDGGARALKLDDVVPEKAKISSGADSSAVLVFSNGATVKLGADTEVVVQEFQQDPFGATIKLSELEEEPSRSRTVLALNRGDLVGNVKGLKSTEGSSFTVQSPVGVAGVREGPAILRMVFRPSGAGQAFFSLSCATGNVVFQQPHSTTGAGEKGIVVPAGQEISIAVSVTQNAQGGLVVTTSGPVQPKPLAPAKEP